MEEKIVHSVAALCLRMQSVFNIPSASIDEILKCLHTITSFESLHLCHKIEEAVLGLGYNDSQLITLVRNIVMEESTFVKCIGKSQEVCNAVQGMLCTNDRRMSYYKTHFPYVAPIDYKLGYKFGKSHSFMYVPILSSLQKLLAIPEILGEVVKHHVHREGVYTPYEDGSYYQSNELFHEHEISLKIGLYHDDWESVNPLGTAHKMHKISAFYWVLLNLPPVHRSALKVIQLCVLAKSQDVRLFGLAAVLRPLLNDISVLESEGVFGPNVNKFKFCRFCDADSTDISDVSKNIYLRTKSDYDTQAVLACGPVTGVKLCSPLHGKLNHFHVVSGLHTELLDYYPLSVYRVGGKCYVTMKHFVCGL